MLFAVPLEIILSITRRHHCQYEVEKEPSRCNVEVHMQLSYISAKRPKAPIIQAHMVALNFQFLYQHNEKRQSNESQKEYLVVAFK